MPKNLVIVESPAKAKTIEKFLGHDYQVIASFGHVRDLPKSKLGIDIEHNFEPQYIIPRSVARYLNALKKAIRSANQLYLATDLDREGEAIAWHIIQAIPPLKDQQVKRITFSEITGSAIREAVAHPRQINMDLVNAQQARRVLDRLVGYSLSPILWKKVRSGLSAGRVQSVALKFIVDREKEIGAFKSQEFWSIEAILENLDKKSFNAYLIKIDGKKAEIKDKIQAKKITDEVKNQQFSVHKVETREVKKNPLPPFITSTLQQGAYSKLGFSAKKTMTIAQMLYETGYISYMRTDSVNLSGEALSQIKTSIIKQYGAVYALEHPRIFKKKAKRAQEAHEAIRPTVFSRDPDSLSDKLPADQLKLYKLIYLRTVASQMKQAVYKKTAADLKAGKYSFRASGREVLFDGFTKIYKTGDKDDKLQILPKLLDGE
ncbi:MAG: type I DNA topoisomerase, partial [bacterium]|nr:type I DNA topoisomerase [bacterium]